MIHRDIIPNHESFFWLAIIDGLYQVYPGYSQVLGQPGD